LDTPDLTAKERAHIENGGRVFVVEKIPGPLWRVLSISNENGCYTLCQPEIPEKMEGYGTMEFANDMAKSIAALSEDKPMVRICH
jgi:hypothetical protein